MVPTGHISLDQNLPKCFSGRVSVSDPTEEACSAPVDLLVGLSCHYLAERGTVKAPGIFVWGAWKSTMEFTGEAPIGVWGRNPPEADAVYRF